MDKLGDLALFVKIVKHNGLAAAGRELGISPASMSLRLNRLEDSYGVRLLNRTTRKIALTEEGREFYKNCLHILANIERAEEQLINGRNSFKGNLTITAPIDLGKQYIAPLLADFVKQNPQVSVHLDLADHVVDLLDGGYDLAIRYGALKDNRMVAKKLSDNRRVLCASPKYIEEYGEPKSPSELLEHKCITMRRRGRSLREWYFSRDGQQTKVTVDTSLSSNDGAQVREWAVRGLGVALKSYCDIETDLKSKKLRTLLDDYQQNYDLEDTTLYAVYLSRKYMPKRTRAFLDLLIQHFSHEQTELDIVADLT